MLKEIGCTETFTLEEVSELIGMSMQHLKAFVNRGDIEIITVDDVQVVTVDEFTDFAEKVIEGRAIFDKVMNSYEKTNNNDSQIDLNLIELEELFNL